MERIKDSQAYFRDFNVRVWKDGVISMDCQKEIEAFVSDTFIGVQTNTYNEEINKQIEQVCGSIRDNFKELNELLNKIR